VAALLDAVGARPQRAWPATPALPPLPNDDVVSIRGIADTLAAASQGMEICIARLTLGWNGAYRHFHHPLDYLGSDGGGGVGAGPGNTVGIALALRDSGRLTVGIIGDGDFLMGNTAVWTAVHYGIPLLLIVCNNHSFFNDELHQERVARARERPPENKWIGQRMADPEIDIAQMARSMGAEGIGPVKQARELRAAIEQGLEHVRQGKVCVIDACVAPGYDTNMSGAAASSHKR